MTPNVQDCLGASNLDLMPSGQNMSAYFHALCNTMPHIKTMPVSACFGNVDPESIQWLMGLHDNHNDLWPQQSEFGPASWLWRSSGTTSATKAAAWMAEWPWKTPSRKYRCECLKENCLLLDWGISIGMATMSNYGIYRFSKMIVKGAEIAHNHIAMKKQRLLTGFVWCNAPCCLLLEFETGCCCNRRWRRNLGRFKELCIGIESNGRGDRSPATP